MQYHQNGELEAAEREITELGLTLTSIMSVTAEHERVVIQAFGELWEISVKKVRPEETTLLVAILAALLN